MKHLRFRVSASVDMWLQHIVDHIFFRVDRQEIYMEKKWSGMGSDHTSTVADTRKWKCSISTGDVSLSGPGPFSFLIFVTQPTLNIPQLRRSAQFPDIPSIPSIPSIPGAGMIKNAVNNSI